MTKIIITEWAKDDPLAPSSLPENIEELCEWTEREAVKQMAREAERLALLSVGVKPRGKEKG